MRSTGRAALAERRRVALVPNPERAMTSTLRLACALLLLLASNGSFVVSQPLGTDLFVAASGGNLLRLSPGKATQVVGSFTVNQYLNMITMDADNYHVVALDIAAGPASSNRLVRIDPVIGEITTTIWAGPPLTRQVSWIEVDADGDYIVSHPGSTTDANQLLKVQRDGLGVTTLYQGMTGSFFNAFAVDRATGDWVVVDHTNKRVVIIDRATRTVRTTAAVGQSLYGIVQDPTGTAMYLATSGRSFLAFDPSTGAVSTLGTLTHFPNAIAVDRAPHANGALIFMPHSGEIHAYTRSGVNTGRVGTAASLAYGLTFDRSRNLSATLLGVPNDRLVHVSFPNAPGAPFAFALSASGDAPGLPLADGRAVPLVRDPLFDVTAGGALYPVLFGNHGTLNAAGDAYVRFNASALGASVRGLRLWGAALTLDRTASTGIGEISAPMLFVL